MSREHLGEQENGGTGVIYRKLHGSWTVVGETADLNKETQS